MIVLMSSFLQSAPRTGIGKQPKAKAVDGRVDLKLRLVPINCLPRRDWSSGRRIVEINSLQSLSELRKTHCQR